MRLVDPIGLPVLQ